MLAHSRMDLLRGDEGPITLPIAASAVDRARESGCRHRLVRLKQPLNFSMKGCHALMEIVRCKSPEEGKACSCASEFAGFEGIRRSSTRRNSDHRVDSRGARYVV